MQDLTPAPQGTHDDSGDQTCISCRVGGGLAGCANMTTGEQRSLSGTAIGTAAGALVGELATTQPLHGAVLGPLPEPSVAGCTTDTKRRSNTSDNLCCEDL